MFLVSVPVRGHERVDIYIYMLGDGMGGAGVRFVGMSNLVRNAKT